MRDALADVFFPATNTIMTRTRYLVFVPALYQKVEQEQVFGTQAAARMKALENLLRAALDRPGVFGVIGRRAKEDLARYPSNVYWSALKQLGIFLRPRWSQSYYHDHLKQFYANGTSFKDDDGLTHLAAAPTRNWDTRIEEIARQGEGLIDGGGENASELDFDLTAPEARYILDRFAAIGEKQASLLLHLVRLGYQGRFAYPWDVPCPDGLEQSVLHARCLSAIPFNRRTQKSRLQP
jgi:hypothetical protein